MNQKNAPLYKAVCAAMKESPVPFHMPGHKLGHGIDAGWKKIVGKDIFRMDLSELQGLGNLYADEGPIREAADLAAEAWGADRTFFLVGGSSAGICAAILSCVKPGEKILVPRNAHISIFHALVMSGAVPVWITPGVCESGCLGGINPADVEGALKSHGDIKAVFAVSPTYTGHMSDISAIAGHAHARGIPLIVDEAHGSHLYFRAQAARMPLGALACCADIVIHSVHKTAGSLTQSSLLHYRETYGVSIDPQAIAKNLALTQSTSPSYLLMASLDLARRRLATKGREILGRLLVEIEATKRHIAEAGAYRILARDFGPEAHVFAADPLHLVVDPRERGYTGRQLYRLLRRKYHIEAEYAEEGFLVFLLGIGTTAEDLRKLRLALKDLAWKKAVRTADMAPLPPAPPQALTPREAWFAPKEAVPFADAEGRVCGEVIMTYPPGIPFVCPGERLEGETLRHLAQKKNEGAVFHASDSSIDTILCIAAP
jgi:arginine decarboxylase